MNPLTDADLEILDKVIARSHEIEAYCQSCNDCGLNTDKELKLCREQRAIATKIKARFLNGQPS